MSGDEFVPMGDTLHVRIEGDLVFIRNHRSLTLVDLYAILDIYRSVHAEHGNLFAIYDCSRAEGVERAARKELTSLGTPAFAADATAVFGAPFAVRVVANMIERALVGLGRPSTGMQFFQTEKQARDYLHEQRIRLRDKG